MSTSRWFRWVVVLLVAVMLAGSASCVVRARPVWVVDVEPPPPRVVHVHPRPGMVWIEGRWEYVGGAWRWRDGHWVRERRGHVYRPGAWVHVGGRWQWNEGRWDRDDRPKVRDHREERPKVRDHR